MVDRGMICLSCIRSSSLIWGYKRLSMIYIGLAVDIILTKYCNNYKFLAISTILPKYIWKIDLSLAPKVGRKMG